MKKNVRRLMSMVLALVMIINMVPVNAFTAVAATVENDPQAATAVGDMLIVKGDDSTPANPTNVPGTHWEFVKKSDDPTCEQHAHSDGDCTYACSHSINRKHLASCYGGTWQYCPENDGGTCNHTNSVKVTASNIRNLDTEIYSAVTAKYGTSFGILNAYNKYFCYKLGDTLICDHQNGWDVHTDACCANQEGHTHSEPDCYSYTWELVYDTLSPIKVEFEGNTPNVTVTSTLPESAKYNDNITFTLSATDDDYNTWTATINGKNPTKLSKTEPTEVIAEAITSGTIKVVLTSQAVPTYTITVEEKNKQNGCAYTLDKNSNLLPGNTAELTVVVPTGDNSYKFTPSVTVSGAGASYANGIITVGAENVTVTIDYQPKKLVVNNSSEDAPVEIPYNYGVGIAEQQNAVKEAIYNALVNSGASLPATLTSWSQLTYQYYPQGKLTGNYSGTAQEFSTGTTGYFDFGETGKQNATYDRGNVAVEKIKIIWAEGNGLPEVFADVYVKLAESRKYTVTWKNDDGTVLETDTLVVHGTTPEYNGNTPTKNADAQYTYTFAGWSPAVAAADKDIVYTATYGTTTNTYTVVWKDHDGTVLETDSNVPYGTTPTYDNVNGKGTTEQLAAALNTTQYTNSFAGWTPTVNPVTGNKEYTATYSTTLNKYTTTFKNYDGTVLQTGLVSFGEVPSYEGATPTKPADAQYTYTFNGWDNTVKAVDGEMTYTAVYSETVNTYTVIWKNEDGTVLETDNNVPYGDMPQYNGNTPTKADDDQNVYKFDKWCPTVDSVKGNAEYIATFTTEAKIKVTFSVLGDTTRYTNVIPNGKVSAYADPEVTGYRFDGWYQDADCTTAFDFENTVINSATTIYAKMTKMHTVAFNTSGGSPAVDNQTVADNGFATVPNVKPDKLNETFIGWYLNDVLYDFGTPVTADITLVAEYGIDTDNDEKVDGSDEDPFLTYKWIDGEVLFEKTILSGAEKPTYIMSDPTDNNKVFIGWNQSVNGNITVYTAIWADDENNNDRDDNLETATITVNKTGNGTVTLVTNGNVILKDNLDGTYTFIYDSTNDASKQVTVNTQPTDTGVSDKKNYLVSATESVTVANGTNAVVTVKFALRELVANGNKEISVNGFSADTEIAGVSKKAVLEAILGRTLTDTEVAQYSVKMYVQLADLPIIGTIERYEDIWDLANRNYGDTINATIKSAIAKAIDVGGKEQFEIIWLADGIAPTVTGYYEVTLKEDRDPTTVTHTGGTYTSGELDDILLQSITPNLTSNTSILGVKYGDNTHIDFVFGKTYTVNLIITVEETVNYYGAQVPVTVTIYVPYTKATVTIESEANMNYNTGMTDVNKVNMVISAVNPQYLPELPVGVRPTVWYLASEARKVDVTINFAQMDLGLAGRFLPDTATIQVPVDEMWLNIGDDLTIPAAPSNERFREIILNDLIPNYGADYIAGHLSTEQMMDILATTLKKYPDVAEYYKYLGAHYFGENTKVDTDGNVLETVYVAVPDFGYGPARSNECVITLSDLRSEVVIKLNEGVTVTYGKYSEAELLAALVEGVYDADGNRIGGAELVTFVTNVIGLPVSEASLIEVKFNGDINYKPTVASTNIVINKAPVSVDVDNQIIKWGDSYNKLPVITNPANVDTIQFVVGLDVSDINYDSGVKGIVGNVQLMLPEELQDMLVMVDELIGDKLGKDISFANGASMKLSDLQDAVGTMDGFFEGSEYEEYFNVLLKMLSSLPTETADIMITLGGELPTNVGVYLIGAVTADSNYETAFGVGALVIYPDGIKADIAWNMEDENYIITNSLLASGEFDTQAHAVTVGNGGDIDFATSQILEIFLGVDIYGEITVETDPAKLNIGAYVEIAGIVNWGNQMYYSNILARPMMVVAETLDVDFVDHTGNVNNDRWFEFDNTSKNAMEGNLKVTYKQDGNGYKAGDVVELPYSVRYLYVGVQTNGKPYVSDKAPVHAGTYTITAIVVVTGADGLVSHAGQGIGVLVIEPSKSTITVDNSVIAWDDATHSVNGLVNAESVNVPSITPDTTIISAGISADLDANIGLDSIKGNVNIDMPVWLDEIIKELGILDAAYADGIEASNLIGYTTKIKNELDKLEIDTSSFDSIIKIIEQLPTNATLTFHDNKSYKDVGMYLIIGIVTDSDHYPSVDAGVMVIHPDFEKAELNWKYNDSNNIFTLDTLSVVDLGAYATVGGVENNEVPFKVVYVGIDAENMELILTENQSDLGIGLFTEIAYVVGIDNQMYIADPIIREILIVPNLYEVQVEDKTFVYDGEAKDIGEIVVFDQFNQNITNNGNLYVIYTGVSGDLKGYVSKEAPSQAGIYSVIVTFIKFDDNNYPIGVGSKVVTLVIEKAAPEFGLNDTETLYDGSESFVDIDNDQNLDYVAVIRTENGINIVMTDALKPIADYLGDDIYDITTLETAINKAIVEIEGLDVNSEFVDTLLETLKTVDNNMIYKISINGANPNSVGEYKCYAISIPTANYSAVVSEGTLVIKPINITISVDNKTVSLGENPKFTYTIAEGELASGDEMTVAFTKEYDINTAGVYNISAIVTLNDNYNITVIPGTLTVNPVEITSVEVLGNLVYTGSEQTANVVVKYGDKVLTENIDYVIEGNKYTNAGSYMVTVEGIGNYTGVLSTSWSIATKELSAADVALDGSQLVFNGSEQTQNVTVADGITYTVTGNKGTNAGEYTLTVTFTGNYSGVVQLSWTIILLGDADNNKVVDMFDASLILQYYTGENGVTAEDINLTVSDVDGNGVVDMFDATLILQFYTGEISRFPVEQ